MIIQKISTTALVFTDFMILLVSVLIGLNSTMSFQKSKELKLPQLNLPKIANTKKIGASLNVAFLTIISKKKEKIYYYNDRKVTYKQLLLMIKQNKMQCIVIRSEQSEMVQWENFCQLTSDLTKSGIKEISYAIKERN